MIYKMFNKILRITNFNMIDNGSYPIVSNNIYFTNISYGFCSGGN
jgi:hypothetical protein